MIPVNEPLLDGNERKYLNQCLDEGWVSSEGHFIDEFEEKFSSFLGAKYGVAVSSGTTALETALFAIGIGSGEEVVMPTFTIISCAIAAIRLSAKPVLVDSEPETWNMDTSQIEPRITSKTKAIMPVHIYGHPVDMDPVMELARRFDLKVVEDAAEVHGAEYKGKKAGAIGDAGCFSFYANKIITTGEGGMVVTSDESIARRARDYRNLCFIPGNRFYHTELGYNFRMTNMQAALGVAQAEQIERHIQIKRKNAALYNELLKDIEQIKLPAEKEWAKNVYWMYGLQLKDEVKFEAREVAARLKAKGVDTRPFFIGLHEQPALKKLGLFVGERYPVAEKMARRGLYLPSGLALKEEQVRAVSRALHGVFRDLG